MRQEFAKPRRRLFSGLPVDAHGSFPLLPLHRTDARMMVKRRARTASIPANISCHTFRATGITTSLDNGGTIEGAQAIAAHESPRTTKLYARMSDALSLEEIERRHI